MRQALPRTLYLAALAALAGSIAAFGWFAVWDWLEISPLEPRFADLRTIQGGLSTLRLGLDPQVVNPGDPWGRPMNYPAVWLDVARLLHWDREANYVAFALAAVAGFAGCCYDLLRRYPSWWLVALAVSGAPLLMIERANNDLVIFVLLYLAAVSARPLFAVLVPLAVLLKLYPVLALPAFLQPKRAALVMAALSGAALLALSPQIGAIRAGTPDAPLMSFGTATLSAVAALLGHAISPHAIALGLIAAALALTAVALAGKNRVTVTPATENLVAQRLFLCGAGIFMGAFVLGGNWDYRLSFLLMCVPAVLSLQSAVFRTALVALMAVAFNQPMFHAAWGDAGVYANLAAKAMLFVALAPVAAAALLIEAGRLRAAPAA